MKTSSDVYTAEMFGNRPGRPPKLYPKSAALRTREWRARTQSKAALQIINDTITQVNSEPVISVTSDIKQCCFCGCECNECSGICNIGQLGHLL